MIRAQESGTRGTRWVRKKSYLVEKKEISTHGRLDKLKADWTNCPAVGKNCIELEDRTKHSTTPYYVRSDG